VTDQIDALVADIIQPADERADDISAGFGREQRLRRRETESDVDADAFLRERGGGLDAVANERAFHHHIFMQFRQFASLADHGAGFGRDHFRADIAVYDLANPANLLPDGVA